MASEVKVAKSKSQEDTRNVTSQGGARGVSKNSSSANERKMRSELDGIPSNSPWPVSISTELDSYIKQNFTEVSENDRGNYVRVYRSGNDMKYGQYAIDRKRKRWRDVSFSEFYGGGIVD